MKNFILPFMGLLTLCFSCDKVNDTLDSCSTCNDQIDNYINEYISTTCTNNTTNLNNDCSDNTSIQAAGLARETCLEGALQHPGECNDIGRRDTPFSIFVDGPMPDSLKIEIEHNGHSELNSVDHLNNLNLIFDEKINAGVVMRLRLFKIPGDSLLASGLPTMTYARSEANISEAREIEITFDIATGYSFAFRKWD